MNIARRGTGSGSALTRFVGNARAKRDASARRLSSEGLGQVSDESFRFAFQAPAIP